MPIKIASHIIDIIIERRHLQLLVCDGMFKVAKFEESLPSVVNALFAKIASPPYNRGLLASANIAKLFYF